MLPLTLTVSHSTIFSLHPETLGEHLKNHRLQLAWRQKDVAQFLQVDDWTICNWENDKTSPPIRFLPRIIEFLGYDPFPEPECFGEEIAAARRRLGLSRKRLARKLSVDEGALERWEKGVNSPEGEHLRQLTEFLEITK